MAGAISITPITDPPDVLAARLDHRLPGCTVNPIDGHVLIEHYLLGNDMLAIVAKRALRRIYGDDWRQHVEGLE